MKIKLMLCESDKDYQKRLIAALNKQYSGQFDFFSFSSLEYGQEKISEIHPNILLIQDGTSVDTLSVSKSCSVAILVADPAIKHLNGLPAICKYQTADKIYQQLLELYSDSGAELSVEQSGACQTVTFLSPSGGVGVSTLAAAYAIQSAQAGYATLYLNMEAFPSTEVFFSANDGNSSASMEDVVFTVKSGNVNLGYKLSTYLSKDSSGVFFFKPSASVTPEWELDENDITQMITAMQEGSGVQRIIIDMHGGLEPKQLAILRRCSKLICLSNGADLQEMKYRHFLNVYERYVQQETDANHKMPQFIHAYHAALNAPNSIQSRDQLVVPHMDITRGAAMAAQLSAALPKGIVFAE